MNTLGYGGGVIFFQTTSPNCEGRKVFNVVIRKRRELDRKTTVNVYQMGECIDIKYFTNRSEKKL